MRDNGLPIYGSWSGKPVMNALTKREKNLARVRRYREANPEKVRAANNARNKKRRREQAHPCVDCGKMIGGRAKSKCGSCGRTENERGYNRYSIQRHLSQPYAYGRDADHEARVQQLQQSVEENRL